MNKVILLITLLSIAGASHAQTRTVTNTNDSGPGSFREHLAQSNPGDTILFSPGLLSSGSDTIFLMSPVTIPHQLVISGDVSTGDTLFLSGRYAHAVLRAQSMLNLSSPLVLENFAIIQGFADEDGAGLYVNDVDSICLRNMLFKRNVLADTAYGGGAYLRNTRFLIENCRFIANEASGSSGYGGGIYALTSSGIIDHCEFTNNKASYSGGGLRFLGTHGTISNTNFTGNASTLAATFYYGGGGLAISTGSSDDTLGIKLIRCNIEKNTSTHIGGGMVAMRRIVEIQDCRIDSNIASSDGGGIFASGTTIEMTSSKVSNNISGNEGGGVYYSSVSNGTIRGSSIHSNSSVGNGGALLTRQHNLSVESSTIYGNHSALAGGGIYNENCNIEMFNSTVVDNTANSGGFYDAESGTSFSNSISSRSSILAGNTPLKSWRNGVSLGYNVMDYYDPSVYHATDQVSQDSSQISLGSFGHHGHVLPYFQPHSGSVCIDAGTPTDFSDAQNGPIFGQRDVGAAERPIISSDTLWACPSVTWWGNSYNTAGTYRDTVFNANSIDSVGVLVLHRQDTSVINNSGVLIALEYDSNTTYQWVDCNNGFAPVAGATDSAFMPTVNGTYAVILTNDNCSDTSACILYDEVSIEEAARSSNWITFYPNPTSGEIQYKFEGTVPASLEVLDLGGRQIFAQQLNHDHYLKLPGIPAGTYFLRWTGEDDTVQVDRVVVR